MEGRIFDFSQILKIELLRLRANEVIDRLRIAYKRVWLKERLVVEERWVGGKTWMKCFILEMRKKRDGLA